MPCEIVQSAPGAQPLGVYAQGQIASECQQRDRSRMGNTEDESLIFLGSGQSGLTMIVKLKADGMRIGIEIAPQALAQGGPCQDESQTGIAAANACSTFLLVLGQ